MIHDPKYITRGEKVITKNKYVLLAVTGILVFTVAFFINTGFRELNKPKGEESIFWISNYSEAISIAENENKSIMLYFFTTWCSSCRKLKEETFSNQDVVLFLNREFISVKIDAEKQENLARRYRAYQVPTTLFLSSNESELRRLIGYYPPRVFLKNIQIISNQ
jgi:thioredoxin-related protein